MSAHPPRGQRLPERATGRVLASQVRRIWVAAIALTLAVALLPPAVGNAQPVELLRISDPVTSSEEFSPPYTDVGGISADGRYVVFDSDVDLLPEDTNFQTDVYRWDRSTGAVELVSRRCDPFEETGGGSEEESICQFGGEGPRYAGSSAISADGRFVAFESPGADIEGVRYSTGFTSVFLTDMATGEVRMISDEVDGGEEVPRYEGDYTSPSVSADGSAVAMVGPSQFFGDGAGPDIFRWTDVGGNRLISQQDGSCFFETEVPDCEEIRGEPTISGNGDRVAWVTAGRSLELYRNESEVPEEASPYGPGTIEDDVEVEPDLVLADLAAGSVEIVSLTDNGGELGGAVLAEPRLSGDGLDLAFLSSSDAAVPGASGTAQAYVLDLSVDQPGQLVRVSNDTTGAEVDRPVEDVALSHDGRHVAFVTGATDAGVNCFGDPTPEEESPPPEEESPPPEEESPPPEEEVPPPEEEVPSPALEPAPEAGSPPGDPETAWDVPSATTHDGGVTFAGFSGGCPLTVYRTTLPGADPQAVSVRPDGGPADGDSSEPAIADTAAVAFSSFASDLGPADHPGGRPAFVTADTPPVAPPAPPPPPPPTTLSITPDPVDFGTVPVGQTTDSLAVDVRNTSSAGAVVISTATVTAGGTDVFSISTDACSGRTLSPGERCVVRVRARPAEDSTTRAQLVVTSDATTGPVSTTLVVSGAFGRLVVAPSSLDLGEAGVQVPGDVGTVEVTNDGQAALRLTDVTIPGRDFTVFSSTCTEPLEPDTACRITVRFRPTAEGVRADQLRISGDDGTVAVVDLTGRGLPGQFRVSPGEVDFGDVRSGSASPVTILTVTNLGPGSSAPLATGVRGLSSDAFVADGSDCARPLDSGATCTVEVRFVPDEPRVMQAVLVLQPEGSADPVGALLSGRGVTSGLSVSTTEMDFGSVVVGTEGIAQTLRLQSVREVPVDLGTVDVSSALGGFTILADRCSGVRLTRGQGCDVQIQFTPDRVGPDDGTLLITSSATQGPTSVGLMGVGIQTGVQLSPEVIRVGRVTTVEGDGFPAGDVVVLSWDPGIGTTSVTVAADGTFTAYMLVMRRDVTGSRLLVATGPGYSVSSEVLVTPGTLQAPDLQHRS